MTLAALLIASVLLIFSMNSFFEKGETGEDKHARRREEMVVKQLVSRGVKDQRVLEAMRTVERHHFVPADLQDEAYSDYPLPIGHGQTISQPYIVALMTELLELKGSERVLEIGTGSGYQAAILSKLAKEVYTLEIIPELAAEAQEKLKNEGCTNVKVIVGDGWQGLPLAGPFDAIIVTAAADRVPESLEKQLAAGGKLVIPVGPRAGVQELILMTNESGQLKKKNITAVRFVPLVKEGEPEN